MDASQMFAWSPLEVGDEVILATPLAGARTHVVEDILAVHSAANNAVSIHYRLSGLAVVVPIECILWRVVGGTCVPIGAEMCASRKVAEGM